MVDKKYKDSNRIWFSNACAMQRSILIILANAKQLIKIQLFEVIKRERGSYFFKVTLEVPAKLPWKYLILVSAFAYVRKKNKTTNEF